MTHYEDAIELISPVAGRLLGTPDGKVAGKPNLRAYFQRGLEAYPELHFRLEDVLWGINSIVLYYTNQKGTRTGEFMELSASGKVSCGELQCLTGACRALLGLDGSETRPYTGGGWAGRRVAHAVYPFPPDLRVPLPFRVP